MAALLGQHLGDLISRFADFRNTVDSPRRVGLLNALRQVQAEAKQQNVELGATVHDTAQAIAALPSANRLAEAIGVREILGSDAYEAFDRHWVESLLNYYQTKWNPDAFPTHDARANAGIQQLGNAPVIKIAIAGDMGADPVHVAQLKTMSDRIRDKAPDYTIHLGDVYYSGLPGEETTFLSLWPHGSTGSFTLNSNHEMYCGGQGYFGALLADPAFALQGGLSYFALNNDHWLILGLDTAFFAYHQSLLYEEGSLCEPDVSKAKNGMVQLNWLRETLAQHSGKRVILLTHHDGFDVNPATGRVSRKPLLQRITGEFGAVRDWWWYFGHVHAPIIYSRIVFANNSIVSARCAGHGAVPYEPFPSNYNHLGDGQVNIQWAETDLARNGGDPRRAPNGFVLLTLSGADLREEFFDELGRQRWSNF